MQFVFLSCDGRLPVCNSSSPEGLPLPFVISTEAIAVARHRCGYSFFEMFFGTSLLKGSVILLKLWFQCKAMGISKCSSPFPICLQHSIQDSQLINADPALRTQYEKVSFCL
jgi:hypothetical protein